MSFFTGHIMERAERYSLRFAKRFVKDEDGATAVEFAFVALPFFALLFGIMELAIVFFVNSALVHGTAEAGRLIRVGNFQACGGADQFKAIVCENMKGLGDCYNNVRIDVVTGPSFKTITLPPDPGPQPRTTDASGNPTTAPTPNGVYNANAAGSTMVVRAILHYQLVLPPLLTRLDNPTGSGTRTMIATTAFRNEPFPASGTCNPSTQDQITAGTP